MWLFLDGKIGKSWCMLVWYNLGWWFFGCGFSQMDGENERCEWDMTLAEMILNLSNISCMIISLCFPFLVGLEILGVGFHPMFFHKRKYKKRSQPWSDSQRGWYCWWFRNPIPNHLGCYKPVLKNEINLPYQLVFSPDFWLPSTVAFPGILKAPRWWAMPDTWIVRLCWVGWAGVWVANHWKNRRAAMKNRKWVWWDNLIIIVSNEKKKKAEGAKEHWEY